MSIYHQRTESLLQSINAKQAAEIRALKADKDLLTGQLKQSRVYVETYMKEIQRLRAALEVAK